RLGIDEATDEPWTGDAVDLWMLAGHPFVFGWPALAARRKAAFLPALDASFEVARLQAGAPKRACHALADLMATGAIGQDGPALRQPPAPAGNVIGQITARPDNPPLVRIESRGAAHVDQQRRLRRAKTQIKLGIEDRLSVHAQSPRSIECCAELGRESPSEGESAFPL